MSKGYLVIFALSSLLSCVIANIKGEQQPKQPNDPIKQEYNLDLDWMRQLYHKSAVMALLKGKSLAILEKDGAIIPKYERTVYRLCEKDAKNPIALAKCLVTLMNARDENKRLSLENQNSKSFTFWDVIRSLNVPWEAWKAFIPGSKMFEEKEEYRRMKRTISDQCQYVEPIANLPSSFVQEEVPQPKNNFISPKQIAKKPHYSSNSKMKRIRMNFQDYPNSIHRFRTTPSIRAPKKRFEKYRNRFKRSLKAHEYVQNPNKFRASQGNKKYRPNMRKLKILKEYADMKKYVDKFMKRINKENSNFLKKQGMNINYETQPSKNLNIIEDIFDVLNGYLRKANISEINGINVLTPRIMPYFDRDPKDKEVRVLSPDILSFQKEGFLAWPTIIKLLTGKNNMAYDEWFEFVLEATGANQAMNKAIQLLKNDIVDMKENIYPHVLELEKMEKSWDKANSLHNCKQKSSLEKYGYAFLEPEQIELSYNNKFTEPHQLNLTEYARMTPEDKELMLEDDIRKLAEWGHLYEEEQKNTKHRFKRTVSSPTMNSNLILTAATLSPSAFTTRINQGIILRHVTLSPNAFTVQVNIADILQIYTLSPQAFAVVVLNPAILFSRIISPVAFRAEILQARILHAWVLSPTVFAVRVLSPRILQARVMSSLSMVINILSPGIVHPRAGSPDGPMVAILSPQIFSPRVLSPNFVMINILNPPILSDPLDGL